MNRKYRCVLCCAILRWKVGALKFQETDDDICQRLEVILQSNDTPPLHPPERKIKTKSKRKSLQASASLRGKAKVLLQPTRPWTLCPITHTCPHFLPSSLTHPALASLGSQGSLNNSGMLLPQGLCIGCSLCLEPSSLTIHLAPSSLFFFFKF